MEPKKHDGGCGGNERRGSVGIPDARFARPARVRIEINDGDDDDDGDGDGVTNVPGDLRDERTSLIVRTRKTSSSWLDETRETMPLLHDTTATQHTARLTRDTHQREPPLIRSSRTAFPLSTTAPPSPPSPPSPSLPPSLVLSPPAGLLDPPTFPFRKRNVQFQPASRGSAAPARATRMQQPSGWIGLAATAGAESSRKRARKLGAEFPGENLRISRKLRAFTLNLEMRRLNAQLLEILSRCSWILL